MIKFIVYILLFFSIIFTLGCENKNTSDIKIGFVAGLSGKYSTLGNDVKDGFLLAFDNIDYKINNQKVRIIQQDDMQNKINNKKAINYFIQNNIKLIVGNTTSSMTMQSLKILKKHQDMLMLSATASSTQLSNKDDNFIRVQVANDTNKFKLISDYILTNKFDKIFFLYDSKNNHYSKDYEDILENILITNGAHPYMAKVDINTPKEKIVKNIKNINPNLIIIVANSLDSANMIQYIRFNNISSQIFCSGWAMDDDFIQNGGKAIENVLFTTAYNSNDNSPQFKSFTQHYQELYHKIPSENAMQGYELAQIIIQNLQQSEDIGTLKKRILSKKIYKGLQGDIVLNRYGDATRKYYIVTVKNRKFVRIDEK